MRIVLHAGNEKTGTTSLQKFLAERYSHRGGRIYYPTGGRGTVDSHRQLYDELASGKSEEAITYLKPELIKIRSEIVLVSCEIFSSQSPQSFTALNGFAKVANAMGANVHMITVVRSARQFLYSLFLEGLNWGRTEDYELFLRRHLARLKIGRLKEIADEFGWTSAFLKYEPTTLLKDFMMEIDPSIDVSGMYLDSANVTYPASIAPILLQLNRTYQKSDLTRQIRQILSNIDLNPTKQLEDDLSQFFGISAETEKAIEEIELTDPIRSRLFQGH